MVKVFFQRVAKIDMFYFFFLPLKDKWMEYIDF